MRPAHSRNLFFRFPKWHDNAFPHSTQNRLWSPTTFLRSWKMFAKVTAHHHLAMRCRKCGALLPLSRVFVMWFLLKHRAKTRFRVCIFIKTKNLVLLHLIGFEHGAKAYITLPSHSEVFRFKLWPRFFIFVVPNIMLCSSEINPTRCNNCVYILRNGFTLHVSGDNLTHHQEYICCIWPQVSRLT